MLLVAFFAADMLLAGLKGQYPTASTAAIDGLTDQPAGQAADELLTASQDAQVRPAESQRIAQRLPFGHDDVGCVIARASEQAEADRIDRHDQERPRSMGDFGARPHVFQAAEEIGMLDDDAGRVIVDHGGESFRADRSARRCHRHQFNVEIGQIGRHDLAVFRMNAPEHDDSRRSPPSRRGP